MADGAVREGMPRDLAYKLTAQTVLGTASLILNENIHPAVLKDNVSSPAGNFSFNFFMKKKSIFFFLHLMSLYVTFIKPLLFSPAS